MDRSLTARSDLRFTYHLALIVAKLLRVRRDRRDFTMAVIGRSLGLRLTDSVVDELIVTPDGCLWNGLPGRDGVAYDMDAAELELDLRDLAAQAGLTPRSSASCPA